MPKDKDGISRVAESTTEHGEAFERLAVAVQQRLDPGSKAKWQVRIEGRKVDGVITGSLGSSDVLVVIECRDYSSRLGIEHIDAWESVCHEVKANKGIMVTRVGYTVDALKKASRVGIDTCVLRPATVVDYPGPGAPIKSINITVRLVGTAIDDLEVELVDGSRRPMGLFYQLADANGETEFIDRVIQGWLATEEGQAHKDGERTTLDLTPPRKTPLGPGRTTRHTASLHPSPCRGTGYRVVVARTRGVGVLQTITRWCSAR